MKRKRFVVAAVIADYLGRARLASARARRLKAQWQAGAGYQFEPYLAARGERSNWVHAARILAVASSTGNSTFAANDRCAARILSESSQRRAA